MFILPVDSSSLKTQWLTQFVFDLLIHSSCDIPAKDETLPPKGLLEVSEKVKTMISKTFYLYRNDFVIASKRHTIVLYYLKFILKRERKYKLKEFYDPFCKVKTPHPPYLQKVFIFVERVYVKKKSTLGVFSE